MYQNKGLNIYVKQHPRNLTRLALVIWFTLRIICYPNIHLKSF
jgi:hypothetical protein